MRGYQEKAVSDLRAAVTTYGSAVYALATGAGKTIVAGMIANLATGKGGQVLLVVHRRELVKQTLDTLNEFVPDLPVGIEAPGWPSQPSAPLQIGMVQSMVRRDHVARMQPTLIIYDEAHHVRASTWEKTLQWWPDTPRIGLTATPERLDGKGLGEHFASMVMGPSIPELVENAYLAPCRTLTIPIDMDLAGLKRNKQGEYGDAISSRISDSVVADAANAYIKYANGKRALFFGENRDHSRRVCQKLRSLGIRAEHVDGDDTPTRRDRIMMEFRTGGLDLVGNCDLISEGFNAPSCEVVMLGKRTRSVTRYLQQAGRAMRPQPGKTALILDLAGISYELGLPDEHRAWSLTDGEVQATKVGKPSSPHVCPECRTAFYGSVCPICSFAFPPMESEIIEVQTPLIEATGRKPKAFRSEVWRELALAKRSPNPRTEVEAIAVRRGYKAGWAVHILRAWGIA